ncbi:YitT family protein [Asticcacaulis sp. SL142]|uniref:YitT family protein n=1 Tax=Asticcacaulis sp. SL142 TaxID=2995155 RepID=UPI00226CC2F7|nr:YitT family protein [Asticcacaulis sp. SL142]WAC49596.1 YitT family protein [Asticcacaulis sp. SL142]
MTLSLRSLLPKNLSRSSAILDDQELKAQAKHTLFEDIYAFAIGCSFIALGLVLLKTAGLVTGGVAGIALLVSYLVPLPVGLLFNLINVPFFVFAFVTMGWRFTVKTIVVNIAIMAMAALFPHLFTPAHLNPIFASIFGGTIIGMGILALARHGAGAGGTGVLSLYLQKTRGINAGKTQAVCDALIMTASVFVVSPMNLLYSVISAAAMSTVMMTYHKPQRYLGH